MLLPASDHGGRGSEQGEGRRPGDDPAFRHLGLRGVEHPPLDRREVETEGVQAVGGDNHVLILVLGNADADPDLHQLEILFIHVDRFDVRENDGPEKSRGFR